MSKSQTFFSSGAGVLPTHKNKESWRKIRQVFSLLSAPSPQGCNLALPHAIKQWVGISSDYTHAVLWAELKAELKAGAQLTPQIPTHPCSTVAEVWLLCWGQVTCCWQGHRGESCKESCTFSVWGGGWYRQALETSMGHSVLLGRCYSACDLVSSPLRFLGDIFITYQALHVKPVASGSWVSPDVTDLKGEWERKLRELDK